MKKIVVPIVALASLVMMSFTPAAEKNIKGIWIGAYGTEDTIINTVIYFKKNGMIEVFSQNANTKESCKGSYSIGTESNVTISYKTSAKATEVTMTGKLNPSNNFLQGDWQISDSEFGSFYLQKQSTGNSEKIISVKLLTTGK